LRPLGSEKSYCKDHTVETRKHNSQSITLQSYKSCMLHLYLIIVDQSNAFLIPVIWRYQQCSGITQDKGLNY
jgi:hypothetical protein